MSSDSTKPDTIQRFARLYKSIASLPSVKGARLWTAAAAAAAHGPNVTLTHGQRDLNANCVRTHEVTYLNTGDGYVRAQLHPTELTGVVAQLKSPSGRLHAVIRSAKAKSGDASKKNLYRVEINDANGLVTSIPTEGRHGAVFTSGTLGGLCWSPDETALAYVANAIVDEKATSFWEPEDEDDDDDDDKDKDTDKDKDKGEDTGGDATEKTKTKTKKMKKKDLRGRKYLFRGHFGEQLSSASLPKVFVVDIARRRIKPLLGVSDAFACGQVTWAPDQSGVVFVRWPIEPRHLGLLHYNSRQSTLCFAPVDLDKVFEGGDAEVEELTSYSAEAGGDFSPMCPRFSPDGSRLLFVTTDNRMLHTMGSRLRVMDWSSRSKRTVIDVVDQPKAVEEFPGLWPCATGLGLISTKVWLGDNRRVVLSTGWRSQSVLLLVDTDVEPNEFHSNNVARIAVPAELDPRSSADLLDVEGSSIVASFSNFSTPPVVFVGDFGGNDSTPAWAVVARTALPERDPEASSAISSLHWDVLPVSPRVHLSPEQDDLPFEAILIKPSASVKEGALVMYPHGGPHSADSTTFWAGLAFLCSTGFSVMLVNYRGSRCFGQKPLESLPGRIGTQDVDDVMAALDVAMASGEFDAKKVSVFGGSHGGFLTTHLIGQFPDVFCTAACRNPVTNIPHMCASTDIPDWAFHECGLPFDVDTTPSAEQYSAMFNMSPIRYVAQVRTPLLLCLGDSDYRCPPTQGLDYHRVLKGQGVKTKLLMYPDNQHSLNDSVLTESDSWTSSALWLHGYFLDEEDEDEEE